MENYFRDTDGCHLGNWWHYFACCLAAKSCPTCFHTHGCLSGSSIHGISQARILEWVATSFSRGSSQPTNWTWVSCPGRWTIYHNTRKKIKKKKPTGTLIRNLQELLILKIQEWRRMSRYSVLLLLTFSGWDLTRVHLPVSFAPIECSRVQFRSKGTLWVCFFFFLAMSCSMQDLVSLGRCWTHAPCIGSMES